MDLDFNASTLLYIVGIVLGVVAVIYFGREIIADLSPTIKSILLLLGFPAFLGAGSLVRRRFLDKFFYILSIFSYLVFLWYIFDTFSLGTNKVFLALVISSILFIGMGYSWGKGIELQGKWKKGLLAGLLILMVGLVSFDAVGPQPSYQLDLRERVSFQDAWKNEQTIEEGIPVGKLVVKNDFVFSRFTDHLHLNACLYTPEKHADVYLRYSLYDVRIIDGNSKKEVKISLRPPLAEKEGGRGRPTYMENIEELPIKKATEFPKEVDKPKLVIATGEGPYAPAEKVKILETPTER